MHSIIHHSPTAYAAYIDLLRALKDEAVSDLLGTPVSETRNGRIYWYDSYRIGTSVKRRYIGEDSEELRARLDRAADLRAGKAERDRHRARLVRILRAEGYLGLDAGSGALIGAMTKAGLFRLGGTLVGTQAFRLYEGELGVRIGFDEMAQTGDLDIASFERLSFALSLDDQVSPSLTDVLHDFDFRPVPALEPGKVWKWQQSNRDLLVEFLTPAFTREEGLRPLPALGVEAQALHHLNYLLAEPVHVAAVYRSGLLVQVPRPERFAIHKLIVSERRREGPDALKSRKDRAQAAFLIRVLARERPGDLAEALADARSVGPKWRGRLEAAQERLEPEIAALLA